jgi:FG-GAP-like repeat
VFKGCLVINEQTLERRGEQPLANLDRLRHHLAKVRGGRGSLRLAGEPDANDLEIAEQSFFIVNNLGLDGGDLKIVRRAIAAVFRHHRQREWNRRHNPGSEWIVGEYLADGRYRAFINLDVARVIQQTLFERKADMKLPFGPMVPVLFLLVLNPPLHAQVTFVLASSPGVGVDPNAVVATDVNGDGKVDLISANQGNATLSVMTNNGSGSFILSSSPGVGFLPQSVTTADINRDGKMDLICGNNGDATLSVLTNNGTGGFALSSSLAVGSGPAAVLGADINGDGAVDLICANFFDNTLSILTNNGSGGFTLASTPGVGSGPVSVTAITNLNGQVSLICANFFDSTLSVLTNNGSAGFLSAATLAVGTNPQFVTAATINGNGRMDLICANYLDSTLSVLTNDGNGGFALSSTPLVGRRPSSVTAVDVNGDGKVDLICANYLDSTLSVLTNNGNGGFALSSTPPVGRRPNSVTAADVNGDGRVDLISANQTDNTLSVLINTLSVFTNAPTLTINRSDAGVIVSWATPLTGWTLQQNSNLATTNWSATGFGIVDDGTNKNITITQPAGNLFFRLSNP